MDKTSDERSSPATLLGEASSGHKRYAISGAWTYRRAGIGNGDYGGRDGAARDRGRFLQTAFGGWREGAVGSCGGCAASNWIAGDGALV